jgi:DNA-directed RNA polymerase specialized sigma24 family protein
LRVKRGGGRVRTEAELDQRGASTRLDDHAGDGPSPELLAIMAEEHERLLGLLRDDRLRLVAVLKLLGHSHEEIGQLLGVSVRTVIRKLNLIRDTWDGEVST